MGWSLKSAAALILPFFVFFSDMIFQGRGFFYGDYRAQYYPWALELARALKRLTLPFWSPDIGCGFPLLAEGQAGALQPLKWILYGLLPIEWGYPLGFLAAFFAAGWFVCCLLRRLDQPFSSGILAAWVYCYGSAYAGLVWGNASLWVLAWLPLVLDRAEALCARPGWGKACKLGIASALLWVGGFPQMALYASVFAGGYVLLRRPAAAGFGAFALTAGLLAGSAQMLPTLELAAMSARSQTGLEFALQKSLHPANLSTLVMPSLGFWGSDLYIGILPLMLAFYAAWRSRKDAAVRALTVITAGALFLALGKWNPLYVAIVRSLELYSFRASSKWAVIATLGLALLAGLGWGAWWKDGARRAKTVVTAAVLGSIPVVWAAGYAAARWAEPAIRSWAEAYVRSDVYGKAGHPHSMENYLSRISGLIGILTERTSLSNYYVICVFAVFAGVLVWFWMQRPWMSAAAWKRVRVFGLLLVLADLFWFSWVGSGFRGNRVPASTLRPDAAVFEVLRAGGGHRAYEFIRDPMSPPDWIPNSNLIAGYPSVGVYTPLALSSYSRTVDGLGAVDDSTGVRAVSYEVPVKEAERLARLNVRFLMSKEPLPDSGPWKRIETPIAGTVLYEHPDPWPRVYRGSASDPAAAGNGLEVLESRPGFYRIAADLDRADRIVISENAVGSGKPWDSGWVARIDGKSVAMAASDVRQDGFVSIPVPAGTHEVTAEYRPMRFWIGLGISLMALALLIAGALKKRIRS